MREWRRGSESEPTSGEAVAVVEFRVLGPMEVRVDGRTVAPRGDRQRTLLAVLLVAAGRVVPMDALAEALWGEQPPADPRNAIQTYVARLRGRLGGQVPLRTHGPGYALEVRAEQVDARLFDQLVEQAHREHHDPATARSILEEAFGLWRGPAYAGISDTVVESEARRLAERYVTAREAFVAARLALGEAQAVLGDLEAMTFEHPLREHPIALRMRALATIDRVPEALAVYRTFRTRLADESGLDPSPSLRELEQAILRGEVPRGPSPVSGPAAPPRVPATSAAPAPVAPSSLVGRNREMAELQRTLDDHRVVTLTGTGGVGKSRLAAEIAATTAAVAPVPEVGWIELAALSDRDAVDQVVATTLGVDLRGGRSTRQTLLAALAGRRMLLVIDNAEHLLDAVASLVDAIQRACPQLTVLTTSRERLAIDGERVMTLAPLATSGDPDAPEDPAAVRLFLERAAAVGHHPTIDVQRSAVLEICRHLDGLPLAIELAAARTTALDVGDLLAALHDDVPAAVGSRRGEPRRHRNLWEVVEWSYRLLEEHERLLFDRLGVFAGAFDVDIAHRICAAEGGSRASTVTALAALTERSLIVGPSDGPDRPPGRYRLLRPLRAFARQRLADRDELTTLTQHHADTFIERAERAAGPPLTEDGRRWFEASLEDLREVRRWTQQRGDVATLSRLVAAVYRFDYWRPGGELLSWADGALELDGIHDTATAPHLTAAAAAAAWRRGDLPRAEELADRATDLGASADDPSRTLAFEALGDAATFAGRLDDAETAFREEVRLAQLLGDADSEAVGLASAAIVLAYRGQSDQGIELADAAARTARAAGRASQAFARYAQGECRIDREPERALTLAAEAVELARACSAWFVEGVARVTVASIAARHREAPAALPTFADLIHHWHRSGSWIQLWTTLRNLAVLLVRLEADEPAVVIVAAADRDQPASAVFGAESHRFDEALATARQRLGHQRFDAAWRQGAALPPDEIAAFALAAIAAVEDDPDRPARTSRTM